MVQTTFYTYIFDPFYQMQRNAIQQNKEFVTFVGCERDTRAEMLQCLREASLSNMTGYRGDWLPCTDGKIIQRNPAILYELGNWKHNADVVMGRSAQWNTCPWFAVDICLITDDS